jgi:5-methylcytosine-specific restriction protein A
MPVRRCLEPGCGNLSKESRCPEHAKAHQQQRRGVTTGWEWTNTKRRIKKRDDYRCAEVIDGKRCGSVIDLEVDHVVPREQGGTNDDDNLITRCRDCHLRKHGKQRR